MFKTFRLFLPALMAAFTALSAGTARAQATSGSVRSDGAAIAYRVQGHGPVLMLIHGYPLSGELFARNRPALARRYTVVTPDLRGFGHSTVPDTSGSVKIYAHDMFAVMDHLGARKAIIGGMSMGGPVVLEMYREQPQRFRGLILMDTTTSPASIVEQGEWPAFGEQAEQKGVASLVPILMPQMLTEETRMADPGLVKFVGGIVKQGSVKAAVGGGHTLAARPDSRKTKIRVPVLILVGNEDPIYPVEMQQKIHQDTPGSRLVVIPGAAHAAVIEKPVAVSRAILAWAATLP